MDENTRHKEVFGIAVLPKLFPELRDIAHQEAILATIFHPLCWQIRLMLLDPHSIYRIGKTFHYGDDEDRYRIVHRIEPKEPLVCADITFHVISVNRSSYGDLPHTVRAQLPDRGIMPPQRMPVFKDIVIEGDVALARFINAKFHAFVEHTHSRRTLLRSLTQFARERLVDQPYAWLALQEGVARYYEINGLS